MDRLKSLRALIFSLAGLAVVLQALLLNAGALNGDEASIVIILEQFEKLKQGTAQMNPVVSYSGPINFWLMGLPYLTLSTIFAPMPWMMRGVPLVVFVVCFVFLYRELKRHSEEWALWSVFSATIMPIVLVYTRVSWGHSFLLGYLSLLLAEALRARRTGELRLIPSALWVGLSAEIHSTAFVGVAAILGPVIPEALRTVRKRPLEFVAGTVLALALSYSVWRNFPPPIDAKYTAPLIFEIRSALNIVTGAQPFTLTNHYDPAPHVLMGVLILFYIVLFYQLGRWALKKKVDTTIPAKLAPELRQIWWWHLGASILIFIMSHRGRTMVLPGTERYLVALAPGWIVILGYAIAMFPRVVRGKDKRWNQVLIACLLFSFNASRFFYPLLTRAFSDDSFLLATRWLERNCPRESCVVYMENFWNYWPARFYSRDRLAVNFVTHNWIPVPHHEPNGRKQAGCWFYTSPDKLMDELQHKAEMYRGPHETRAIMAAQPGLEGQVCFSGIQIKG